MYVKLKKIYSLKKKLNTLKIDVQHLKKYSKYIDKNNKFQAYLKMILNH